MGLRRGRGHGTSTYTSSCAAASEALCCSEHASANLSLCSRRLARKHISLVPCLFVQCYSYRQRTFNSPSQQPTGNHHHYDHHHQIQKQQKYNAMFPPHSNASCLGSRALGLRFESVLGLGVSGLRVNTSGCTGPKKLSWGNLQPYSKNARMPGGCRKVSIFRLLLLLA